MFIKVFAAMLLVSGLLGGVCSGCTTQWFDRDDPNGEGDYELLSDLLKEYPGLICSDPIAFEVQTVSGQPASQTGNIFELNDATSGFACVNANQKGKPCVDYRVRFTCPAKYDPLKGFVCVNKRQNESSCEDYMVRFTCPWEFCEKWGSVS